MMTYSAKLLLLLTIYAQLQPPISAINVNLSSIWSLFGYTDNGDDHEKRRKQLVFPRRDLIQELGGDDDEYKRLVQYALGLDGNKEEEAKGASDDTTDATDKDESILHYGVDVSFPMQRHEMDVVDNEEEDQLTSSLKQSQLQLYSEYVNGCNEYYNKKYPITTSASTNPCTKAEEDRFDMNLNQPPVMQNYTMLGFQKTTVPKDLHQLLSTFWKKHQTKQKLEVWDRGEGGSADTHLNHWSSPTYMVHIDNPYFEGGGMELKNYIWHVARQKLENWINNGGNPGQSRKNSGESNDGPKWTLSPTSLYGIRVYKSNSILAPHVDRLPLVTSAIINVDQDVDEDWPLEVIGHDGVAYNITMKPGEMLLYESHSLIHGRPYPLKGKYYANIFVHFEPSGHCIRHADRFEGKDVVIDDAKDLYERAQANLKQRLEDAKKDNNGDSRELSSRGDETDIASVPSAPAYIAPHTFEEKRWNQELQYAMDLSELKGGSVNLHTIAGRGNLAEVMYAYQLDPVSVVKRDGNGWQPLHEATRSGHLPVVKFLIEEAKANKNARTGSDGTGGSPLWWAYKYLEPEHPVVIYLQEIGASSIEPGPEEPVHRKKVVYNSKSKDSDNSNDKKNEKKIVDDKKEERHDDRKDEESNNESKETIKAEL